MIEKDKQLLLVDLCARVPHHSKGHVVNACNGAECDEWLTCATFPMFTSITNNSRLYLRSMSSMTDEEKEELKSKCIHTETEEDWEGVRCDVWGIQILDKYDTRRWDNPIWPSTINMDAIDWLNKHHFDYRGLIEKDLALEAPSDMYKMEG